MAATCAGKLALYVASLQRQHMMKLYPAAICTTQLSAEFEKRH